MELNEIPVMGNYEAGMNGDFDHNTNFRVKESDYKFIPNDNRLAISRIKQWLRSKEVKPVIPTKWYDMNEFINTQYKF